MPYMQVMGWISIAETTLPPSFVVNLNLDLHVDLCKNCTVPISELFLNVLYFSNKTNRIEISTNFGVRRLNSNISYDTYVTYV